MMRTFRENSKYVFWILVISFVGWLAYGQVLDIVRGGGNAVLRVNGRPVSAQEFQLRVQQAYDQFRRQNGTAPRTKEDDQAIQNQVAEQMEQEILLRQQYQRLGITVTDQEIVDAARSSPPPQVMQLPEFQTNGQFDPSKYERYLQSGADPQFLAALEAQYREQIPFVKLIQYVTADVYVSDAKLWRIYRDAHDSVTVALLAIHPQQVPDSAVSVSDAEVEAYYAAHKKDFNRPAVAWLSFVALSRYPNATDSAAARTRVAAARAEIARGAKFADVAKRESADSGSGRQGGDLGWVPKSGEGFDDGFAAGMRALRPGQLSAPILSSFGYHLIRVDSARHDSVRVRHILIPIDLQGPHRDSVESRADTLDRLAAEQPDGRVLDSAARALHLNPVSSGWRLVDGDRLTLGRWVVPDVSVWAFQTKVGETSPVIEAVPAYYVFRLDSLKPAGVRPLAEVRDQAMAGARYEKKNAVARQRAEDAFRRLQGTPNLPRAALALGLPTSTYGPFTRLTPPAALQAEPEVIGAAFGLGVSQRSPMIAGETGYYVVELLGRKLADSSAWVAQRDQQRDALIQAARQARYNQYLAALHTQAKIVDRRKELARQAQDQQPAQ
jgi:peptidyl-prolyl cis-trans isomerase D